MTETYTVDLAPFAHPCHVTFEFFEGDPGVWSYANGDPGYPSTPDDFAIVSVEVERHRCMKGENGVYLYNADLSFKTECVEKVDVSALISADLEDEILELVSKIYYDKLRVEEEAHYASIGEDREREAA